MSGQDTNGGKVRKPYGGSGFWWTAIGIVLVLGVAAAFFGWYLSRGPAESVDGRPGTASTSKEAAIGTRGVVLLFVDEKGLETVPEEVQLPAHDHIEQDVLAVMNALCAGPKTPGALSAIPENTRALTVFFDELKAHVVIEFSRELAARHPGGSAAENATLQVILSTLALNFPEIETCSLLVDGAQVETLGGHIQADQPFALRRWR